ncbi:DUF3764 family protein [Prochlorococcus sp. MIT 1307]|uniref:DUF3764 family protein n=1 Tax=Prochlorococcus sp. MIT 1307 TaxID=3096219 RepID=UPI002A74AC58|nr:DUF3764 family protein [Prochlorococcus sp. MIT 1307]
MRTTTIVGVAAAAIGVLTGSQLPSGVVSAPISITTFKIKVPFDQWASGFDSKEADQMHKANSIKPLFRGVNIDDPSQVVVIHQSRPGSVEKILSENKKMMEAGGHIMRTTQTTNWVFQ